ncbi:pimeloyl-ACP methyl ester carboxylesterase [Arthrobacter stackebrandtii]|uniref:Pimeloyl-ACP methyl ester carboxylesterase n=1 Tax=Arthrobacter stackebrandtii TaxID=272161 RepID=A0ABS4YTP6_9MICC|nr:alpha/beta hydrolase [Arthrobacter stackebrandtii]MBP2412129.1 pimeloyl-ACP methyl ester carboxylesterase [Arthrobacter stackebrandtii]PYH01931.1 alpha/beta hydrolase [Arthrobacter stackebrandtii]
MSVRKVVFGEHEIVMTDTGTVAARTFLLVHGIGMGISYFAQLSTALEGHGRVVAIDLPGFGDAREPEQALTMAQMGALLIDFVRAEQLDRPILVGHSMGTQVVAEAAAQRPDLFPELVLVAPTVNSHERTIGKQAWRMAQDLFGESPKVVAVGVRNYAKTGPRWFIKKLHSMMEHSIEDTLPRIQAQTLVIRGGRDRVCPHGWVEGVTAMIPNATMVEVAGRGHETMVKDGHCVAEYILAHVGAA